MKDVITNLAKNFTYITWTKKIYAAAGFFLVAWEGGCKKLCILSDLCSDIDGSCIFSELCNGVDGNKRDGKIFANSSSSLLPFFFAAQRQYLNVERSVMSQTTSIYVHFFVFNDFEITCITASS